MRQNSKDVSSTDQAIVTVEKTSRKIVFTTSAQSQVTMSLVTSSPLAKSSVQVHNLSTQSSPSTQLSLVPGTSLVPGSSATVNSVSASPAVVSAPPTPAPLSIQLARPQIGPAGPHQTLTVVPGGLRIDQQPSLVVVRQSEQKQQQQHQNKPEQDVSVVNANSVKELWINRIAPPPPSQQDSRTVTGMIWSFMLFLDIKNLNSCVDYFTGPGSSNIPMPRLVNHQANSASLENDAKIQAADKSMIKELLLKRGGATTLEPASPLEVRRDSNSSTGSNQSSNQIVIQVTKPSYDPNQVISKPSFDPNQVKLALPNVSLILTPTTSTLATVGSNPGLTVTSMPPKPRIFPQSLTSFTQSITQSRTSTSISAQSSEFIKVCSD